MSLLGSPPFDSFRAFLTLPYIAPIFLPIPLKNRSVRNSPPALPILFYSRCFVYFLFQLLERARVSSLSFLFLLVTSQKVRLAFFNQ